MLQATLNAAGFGRRPVDGLELGHVRRVWAVWRARAANRRAWWRADEHILRDVGLTRAQVIREASKPCWRR